MISVSLALGLLSSLKHKRAKSLKCIQKNRGHVFEPWKTPDSWHLSVNFKCHNTHTMICLQNMPYLNQGLLRACFIFLVYQKVLSETVCHNKQSTPEKQSGNNFSL